MVLGLVHRLGGHGLAHVGIEGQAEHGDALQALLLQRLKELGADEDQPLDQGWAREVHLRRLERAVQVVHDVDELQQQPLVPGVEPALDVAGGSVAEGLVLGLELPVGGQDLVQAVLGEARALGDRVGGRRLGRLQQDPRGPLLAVVVPQFRRQVLRRDLLGHQGRGVRRLVRGRQGQGADVAGVGLGPGRRVGLMCRHASIMPARREDSIRRTASSSRSSGTVREMRKNPSPLGP